MELQTAGEDGLTAVDGLIRLSIARRIGEDGGT